MLLWCISLWIFNWICFATFLRVFASKFIRYIGLQFSCDNVSAFGIWVIVTSQSKLESISFPSFLGRVWERFILLFLKFSRIHQWKFLVLFIGF
jgi:hypothetical protein